MNSTPLDGVKSSSAWNVFTNPSLDKPTMKRLIASKLKRCSRHPHTAHQFCEDRLRPALDGVKFVHSLTPDAEQFPHDAITFCDQRLRPALDWCARRQQARNG